MTDPGDESVQQRCPTCGAQQAVTQLECRRCHSDLRLSAAVRTQAVHLHRSCLALLDAGRLNQALHVAQLRHGLAPDAISSRLLAVTLLQLGHYKEAASLAATQRQ